MFPYEFLQCFDAPGKSQKGVSIVKGKLQVLRKLVQEAKGSHLSKRKDATIALNKHGDLFDGEDVTVSYDIFRRLTNSLFEQCVQCVEQPLTVRDLARELIGAVLMVSGGSNFLQVRDRVLAFFDWRDVIRTSLENMLSTAKRACLATHQVGAHAE